MGARHAVLLTPSKSPGPIQLLPFKTLSPVSPLFATFTNSAQLHHSTSVGGPLFSYFYALSCRQRNANSRRFKHLHTLPKTPGVGVVTAFLIFGSAKRFAHAASPKLRRVSQGDLLPSCPRGACHDHRKKSFLDDSRFQRVRNFRKSAIFSLP
jgi:hypothetical protein